MSERKPCRKCLLSEMDQAEVLQRIEKLILLMPEAERASETLYQKRLEICKACEHLVNGQCRKCGCYVELRAAKRSQRCPSEAHLW